jgi:hypothetical protein
MRAIDHAPAKKLLTRFANKAQRAGGGPWSQKLDSKSLPEVFLANTGEDADYHWSLVKEAAASAGVTMTLKPTKQLCAEYERSPKLELLPENLPKLLDALGLAPAAPSYRETWKAALQVGLNAPASVVEAMLPYTLNIDGKSAQEVVQALNQLRALKGQTLRLREASSLVFWGLSKELDNRADMVAKLLEMDSCPFEEPPLHVAICLPATPVAAILFVENKTTFDTLGRYEDPLLNGIALIYSAGFLASAHRLRSRTHTNCYFAESGSHNTGNAERVHAFLFDNADLPCYFFGDLDFSGMGILKAMRQNFPTLRAWDPGYLRLLERLRCGNGHSPAAAGKSRQRDPVETGCSLADDILLPAMREARLFVDQE